METNEVELKFLEHCVQHTGLSIERKINKIYKDCGSDIKKFINEIVKTEDKEIKMTQVYATASFIADDGRHWYRLRAMVGEVKYTESDGGSLKIAKDGFEVHIPNGYGDGTMRYAVVNDEDFNYFMAYFCCVVKGEFNVYDYDCGDEICETLKGRYFVYSYDGIVVFVKQKN